MPKRTQGSADSPSLYDNHFNRLPPQDLEAEQSTLGAIMLENEIFPVILEILPSAKWFYKEAHKKIYAVMLHLHERNIGIDSVTITEELQKREQLEEVGGASYLSSLLDFTPTSANAKHYAKIVKEKGILRSLILSAHEISEMAFNNAPLDIELLLDKSQRTLSAIVEESGTTSTAGKLQVDEKRIATFVKFSRETPFDGLNAIISCFTPKSLTIIGGRPGVGKTALMLSFLRHTAIEEKRPVVYFGSSNHVEEIITLKLLSAISNVEFNDLKRGNVTDKKKFQAVLAAQEILNVAPLHLSCVPKPNILSVLSSIRALRNKVGELGLIFIENFQDLVWPEKLRSAKEECDAIVDSLMSFTNKIITPVIISSQRNRSAEEEGEEKKHLASDLKGTGRLEDVANIIILPERENYRSKISEVPEEDGRLVVVKGGAGAPIVRFFGNFQCWREVKD